MRTLLLAAVVAGLTLCLPWTPSAAGGKPVEGKRPPPTYQVEVLADSSRVVSLVASPSGRFRAWHIEDHIRLFDGETGQTVRLPGPSLPRQDDAPSPSEWRVRLQMSDRHVVWRAPNGNGTGSTDLGSLLLYDIFGNGEVTEVVELSSVLDDVYIVGDLLVREGLVEMDGGLARHVVIHDLETGVSEDVTPDAVGVDWLAVDGSTVAWAERDPAVAFARYVTVRAMDLGRREPVLLQDDEGSVVFGIEVAGSSVHWDVRGDDGRYEARVAVLRPPGRGKGGAALAMIAPVLAWGPLRRRR